MFPISFLFLRFSSRMALATLELVAALADGVFHSGEDLGDHFGVTRAAIWKALKKLPELGLEVHSVRGKGYRLSEVVTLLDADIIQCGLSAGQRSNVREIEILNCVDSTNSHALRKIQNGSLKLQPGQSYICLAEMQTAGRGRRGRLWVSPFGHNLYLSTVHIFGAGAFGLEGLSLVVGLALVQALQAFGFSGLSLKWPNDVLWQGKKLAGILIEINGDIAGSCQVIIGLGLNLKQNAVTMNGVGQPWVALCELGFTQHLRNELFGKILHYQLAAIDRFHAEGFSPFTKDWKLLDITAGKKVELSTVSGSVSGVGQGVDNTGAFLLETETGLRKFYGGEVSLRSAAVHKSTQ
jgi:BirA family biotin operon repressor/biotin-[acetyl-CoA-carboxylase] ligase